MSDLRVDGTGADEYFPETRNPWSLWQFMQTIVTRIRHVEPYLE